MTGNIVLIGTITCTPDDLDMLITHIKDHIRLSRQEVGCIKFDIIQSKDDPCKFNVSERFVDQAAFDSHSARTRASLWWQKTKHIPRDIQKTVE